MNIRFLAQSEYFNGIHLKDDIILEKEYEEKNSCVSLMYGNGSLPATDAGYTGG